MSSQQQSLTVLISATPGWGHINAAAGAVSALLKTGYHRLVYLLEESFAGKLAPLGFEELLYSNAEVNAQGKKVTRSAGEKQADDLLVSRMFGPDSPEEKMRTMVAYLDGPLRLADIAVLDQALKRAISSVAPDVIFYDGNACPPAIHYSGVPWVRVLSNAPLMYAQDESLPPGASGYPSNGANKAEWAAFNELRRGLFYGRPLNDKIEELGYERYPGDARSPADSPMLTVYATPEELNYEPIRRTAGWFNLEVFNKNESRELIDLQKLLPEEFLRNRLSGEKYSGKLIYVSMGSLGSVDLQLMKRLVEVLGATRHQYIFSKGAKAEQYELAANMWGDRFLPQTSIIPQVDLVITHGGNNSVTETFAHGVPMIVLPNFADQFDNAQRLAETGLGARLDPYRFTAEQLTAAIDGLLFSEELRARLKAAAERIQRTDRHRQLARTVEEMVAAAKKKLKEK